jgi:hypothetical protein
MLFDQIERKALGKPAPVFGEFFFSHINREFVRKSFLFQKISDKITKIPPKKITIPIIRNIPIL